MMQVWAAPLLAAVCTSLKTALWAGFAYVLWDLWHF